MRTVQFTFDIAAPPDRVFDELTDLGRLTRWRTLESIRLEPDGPARVGTVLHSTVRGAGRMQFVNEVTALDRGAHTYDDRSVSGTFPIESGWRVEAVPGGSRVHWTTRYQGRGSMPFSARCWVR
ncbi:MAG TPA: SRPBCC family protein [Dermatophilaceae bacterium]|nr:SRPBCC family protein [Dermatophilaceae bacterium]